MFSVMSQEKTNLRDGRGMTVYRRLYLCDCAEDIADLPAEDAPGSGALVADGGDMYLLDHARVWRRAGHAALSAASVSGMGGNLWKS